MTVAQQTPTISYTENGVTTAFAVPFRYNAPSDLRAQRRAANGTVTELVNGTDFTATPGPTNAGGTLTVTAPGAAGTKLTIYRQTARTQTADYTTSGSFLAEAHERALDKPILIAQEIDSKNARAISVPIDEAGATLPAIAQRAGKVLWFGESGQPLAVSLEELAALLDPSRQAGTTDAFSQTFGARSQVVVLNDPGVGEGGYYVEFAPSGPIDFNRAYARVFKGTGTCRVRVFGGGLLWTATGVGSAAVDQTVSLTALAGYDLVVVIDNIVGTVSGVVVFLEEVSA